MFLANLGFSSGPPPKGDAAGANWKIIFFLGNMKNQRYKNDQKNKLKKKKMEIGNLKSPPTPPTLNPALAPSPFMRIKKIIAPNFQPPPPPPHLLIGS